MMTREECIRGFLQKLSIKSSVYNADLELSFETDILQVFLTEVQLVIPFVPEVNQLLNFIQDMIDDGDYDLTINSTPSQDLVKVKTSSLTRIKQLKYRVRDFVSTSNEGLLLPVKYFTNPSRYEITDIERGNIHNEIRKLIQFLGHSDFDQPEYDLILSKIETPQKHQVIFGFRAIDTDLLNLYSKNYLISLLNGQKTIRRDNVNHTFTRKTSLINNVNSSNHDFTQFFEIMDVLDEYHHSDNILIRYLRLYQIIEYLITRIILVKIQDSSSTQNLFLREMTSIKKYDDFDKSNFNKVFQSNKADLSTWFQGKLNASQNLQNVANEILYPHSYKTIAVGDANAVFNALLNLIYKLRNTIVHNKESEIHLTIHNIQLKPSIISLVKMLLKKLEKIILDKIVFFEPSIKYNNKYLELY